MKSPAAKRRVLAFTLNAILVLVILALITATWLPAIYSSGWFHRHFLR